MSQTIQITRRRLSFLDSSLKIDGIIDIVSIVGYSPKYLSQIQRASKISNKESSAKYVKYCLDKELFSAYLIPRKGHGSRLEKNKTINRYYKYYKITEKGRIFLELVS